MSISLLDKPFQPTEEKLITLHGISWEQFKAIEAQLENNREVRLAYLAGVMEIMSPIGDRHEYVKTTLGYLLEAYMKELGIRFYSRSGFTLEAPGYASGTPMSLTVLAAIKKIQTLCSKSLSLAGRSTDGSYTSPRSCLKSGFSDSNQHFV